MIRMTGLSAVLTLAALPCLAGGIPAVEKLGTTVVGLAESNPIVYRGTNYVWESVRAGAPGNELGQPYGRLRVVAEPNRTIGPFARGLCLSCAFVAGERIVVTGTRRWADDTFYQTETTDLVNWTPLRPILAEKGWRGYNTSVCRAGDRYVMVYERGGKDAEVGCQFTMFFAESEDLRNWRTIPGAVFGREFYTGSPCLRHHDGWFYFFYLAVEGFLKDANGKPIETKPLFRMRVVRSRDLKDWTNGDRVVLGFDDADRKAHPGVNLTDAARQGLTTAENRNASDIDMCETDGDLLISYSWGDQLGHEHLALARVRNCSERAFCESFFRAPRAEASLVGVSGTNAQIEGDEICAKVGADGTCAFALDVSFPEWEEDTYVLLPSAAYDGNRPFQPVEPTRGAMWFRPQDLGEKCPFILNAHYPMMGRNGTGVLEGGVGDLALPCGAFFFPKAKKGVMVFFEPQVAGRYTGFYVTNGLMRVQYPARCYDYLWQRNRGIASPTNDAPIVAAPGMPLRSRFRVHEFDCADVPALYAEYFRQRKSFLPGERAPYPDEDTYRYLRTLVADRLVSTHWHNSPKNGNWQSGWPGGLVDVAALVRVRLRGSHGIAAQTLDFLAESQMPCGLFVGQTMDGKPAPERSALPETVDFHFVRRSTDGLFYAFDLMKAAGTTPQREAALRKCADAFVRLHGRYGLIPEYVWRKDGSCAVGGTTAAAILPAALVRAADHFKEPRYLEAAKEICERMCREYLSRGLCFGGTGDTGNSPESESCAELLESCVTLAERTGEAKWLEWAKQAAHVLSTWVVSYRFPFPKDSAHGRIGVNSVGSVVASVQNRHAAPGFCIDSGESLRRLAKLTGDAAYQELYDDVRSFFPQAISTPEHPVLGRMVVQDPLTVEFGGLHERVNLSGWEGNDQVGETYWRGAWTMAAFLLMTPDDVDERLAALREGGVEGGTIGAVTNFGDYATVDYELNPTDESRIRCRLTLPRPEHWTGRMWGQGNGGPAGEVGTCDVYALAGDAAVHTDMGTHFGVAGRREVLVDFGHRATHLMTVTGKALIERYYGRKVKKAYFYGQSTGGGQGIHEAERYPDDYDGIVAGVPANHRTGLYAYFLNVKRQAFAADGTLVLTDGRLRTVAEAALDCFPELVRYGVRGRYLVDSRPTPERVAKLLDFLAGKDAFFAAADIRRRLEALFRGLELKGRVVGPGLPLGANLSGMPMRSLWNYAWFAGPDFPDTPQGWLSITDGEVERYLAEMAPVMDATSADLTRFAARGGKLIFFGGLEDSIVPWQPMVDYFARAVRNLGGEEKAADCVRFYLEPGRAHSTGRAYSDFADILQTIVNWVEKRERPEALEAVPNVVPRRFADSRFGKLPEGPYLKVAPMSVEKCACSTK